MMRLGIQLVKLPFILIYACAAFVGAVIGAIFNTPAQKRKYAPPKGNPTRYAAPKGAPDEVGNWWDYDRNSLDNDIEQFRHVDGRGGR